MDDELESIVKGLIPRLQINEGGKLLKGWSRFIFNYSRSDISIIEDTADWMFELTSEDIALGAEPHKCACGNLASRCFSVSSENPFFQSQFSCIEKECSESAVKRVAILCDVSENNLYIRLLERAIKWAQK